MAACGYTAAITLGLVTVAVTLEVLGRVIGRSLLPWVVEVSEYSLPFATLVAAPWLLHRNEHVRLDVLFYLVPKQVGRALDFVANLLGLAVSAIFLWFGVKVVLASQAAGSMVLKILVFPEWWIFVPLPFCFLLLTIEFLRRLAVRPPPPQGGPHA